MLRSQYGSVSGSRIQTRTYKSKSEKIPDPKFLDPVPQSLLTVLCGPSGMEEEEVPEFSSAAQEAEFWRGRADHWRKAAKDAKEELDEFQVRL